MDRRSFLQGVAVALATNAAERVFPFRVYSIPKMIAIAPHTFDPMFLRTPPLFGEAACLTPELLRRMQKRMMDALGYKMNRNRINFYPEDYFA